MTDDTTKKYKLEKWALLLNLGDISLGWDGLSSNSSISSFIINAYFLIFKLLANLPV